MFCQNCGAQLSDGASFCANCGTKIINDQNTAGTSEPPKEPNSTSQSKTVIAKPSTTNKTNMIKGLLFMGVGLEVLSCFLPYVFITAVGYQGSVVKNPIGDENFVLKLLIHFAILVPAVVAAFTKKMKSFYILLAITILYNLIEIFSDTKVYIAKGFGALGAVDSINVFDYLQSRLFVFGPGFYLTILGAVCLVASGVMRFMAKTSYNAAS